MSDELEVVQVVRLTVGDDEYRGEVADLKIIDQIRKEKKAFTVAYDKLMATLEEHGIEIVYDEAPAVTARATSRRAAAADGPPTAEVRAWAIKNNVPVSTQGRIKGWINEAYEKKLSGEPLKKWIEQHADK
ncbi:histone-like nucleoid-structuring protein Lsr2 [Streptomyces sp. NPDC050485]|uniref:Lsr2 family DNA-binding protein n=1 Tax=Streptomyces sp. NPDC050485 TaxID=3365617 RepID=UPI0037B80F37